MEEEDHGYDDLDFHDGGDDGDEDDQNDDDGHDVLQVDFAYSN